MTPLFLVAFRNVWRNRRRSLMTFSALLLSVAVVVTLRGLVNGMVAAFRETVVLGQTGALQVHRTGYSKSVNGASLDLDVPTDEAFLATIRAAPGVKAVTARIAFGAMVGSDEVTSPAMLTAIDPGAETTVCPRRAEMVSSGRNLGEVGPTAAVFAPQLSGALGLKLGQTVAVMTGDRDGALNALDVELAGTYGQAGMGMPERKIGFVPLSFAQDLLRMPGRATEIAVAVDDLGKVDRLKAELQSRLGPAYEVSTFHELVPFLDDAIAAWDFMLAMLSSIFFFIALLGIVNTMLMSVFERTREIGTMMSVGVRRWQVLALFIIEAAWLGVWGGGAGALIGKGIVSYLGHRGLVFTMGGAVHVYPYINGSYLATALLLSVVGACLAALWPALRASSLRPVAALSSV